MDVYTGWSSDVSLEPGLLKKESRKEKFKRRFKEVKATVLGTADYLIDQAYETFNAVSKKKFNTALVAGIAGIAVDPILPQTVVQGFVKDKDFPTYSIDSAFVKGIDLNTLDSRFETFSGVDGFYTAIVTTSAVPDETKVPTAFDLSQNYPNPFNPATKIDVLVAEQGNYNLRVFNILGEEVLNQGFDLSAGNHTFELSGLGSAQVLIYNFSGKNFSESKKMVQLDGSSYSPSVSVSSGGSSALSKVNNLEMRISAEKSGYLKDSTDVSYVIGSTNNLDFLLSQVPKQDTVWIYSGLNLVPTNTAADGAVINANGSQIGTTNSQGLDTSFVLVEYLTNPLDSTDKKYFPPLITLLATRNNAQNATETFLVDGSNIEWTADMQQTLINKNGNANGNVQNDISSPVNNANVKLYNNDNNQLFGQGNTNFSGNYQFNFTYPGFENDPADVHTPINDLRLEATVANHTPKTIIKPFENPVITNFVLDRIAYVVNAAVNIYDSKGDVVTDLDSLKLTWSDGTSEMVANNNGVMNLNKLLYTLNSDTTAIITHERPNLYLGWFMGTTNNPDKVELIYQNPGPGPNTVAKIPLNQINNKTTELYLIPKQAKYGPNNDLLIDMDGPIVTGFLNRPTFHIVSGFRPSQYDTTEVTYHTYNEDTGIPVAQNHIDRALNEIQKFLTAVDSWSHKKILNYRFTQVESSSDPFWQNLRNPEGRNLDNVSKSIFWSGGPINNVNISLDGSLRIKYSTSKYNTGSSLSQIREEIFCSLTNTTIDGADYIASSNIAGVPYTDLARNLIGISLIMKTGTFYYEWE